MDDFEMNIEVNENFAVKNAVDRMSNKNSCAGQAKTQEDFFIFKLNRNKKGYSIGTKSQKTLPAIITIPSMHNDLPVTAITDNGFASCSQLSVVLFEEPSRIKAIGMNAFLKCTSMESIELPKSVKIIDSYAFDQCDKLQQVFFHSKFPPLLGHKVFSETLPYLNLYVPENSICIYEEAADWCKYCDLIMPLPNHIPTNLGYFSFELNNDGKSYSIFSKKDITTPLNLVIPWLYNGLPVTIIGNGAFLSRKIRNVVIPDTIQEIGSRAFGFPTTRFNPSYIYSESILEHVIFGNKSTLIHIGAGAFNGNLQMTVIDLPKTLEVIDSNAFFSCGLQSVLIPKNLKSMGTNVFYMSLQLKRITVDKKNKFYTDIDGVMYDTALTTLIAYPLGSENNLYSPPATITDFGHVTFWGCRNLRVLLMNSINPPSLGSLFDGMIPAFKIYVPAESYNSYKTAPGWSQYAGIIYSQSIIQNGFAIVDGTLIQYVENESKITIPKEITQIGNYALTAVTNLEWIDVEAGNISFISENGVLINSDMTKLIAYPPAKKTAEYEVPGSIQTLGIASFFGCNALSTLYVHKHLEILEDNSLQRCRNLKNLINLDASDNIKVLGYGAFLECVSIEDVCFMSLEYSNSSAFSLCYKLKRLTFGPNLKEFKGYLISADPNISQVEWNIFAITPPALAGYWYSDVKSIHVPDESIDSYKTNPIWSYFENKIYPLTVYLIK